MQIIIRFFLDQRLVVMVLLAVMIGWGLVTSPFGGRPDFLPADPVFVDAIPDIGENQQVVFTEWPGRSPQDIEDQVTYPLASALLGLPGVKTVRSSSMFGFSSIYVIFEEDVEFYWSRSRILEKLNALPPGLLPADAKPSLGPDATGLGQVFWYTLEGRDPEGRPVGGWDLHELRNIQDYTVRYALGSVSGVSEVSSIGGYVQEYQVDLDPEAMQTYGLTVQDVAQKLRQSNLDIGARTLEMNRVEYLVRGLGSVESVGELEAAEIAMRGGTPVVLSDIARVQLGPAPRRGILDKSGAEAVGGVVVARFGANPMAVIEDVRARISEIQSGLPRRKLADGTMSQVTIVPFYDRSHLIQETIGTLESALWLEILITILVVVIMVMNLRASLIIAGMLPVAVLGCFILMRYVGLDANVVALSGIAIAIGTMVDMGVVIMENIVNHVRERRSSLLDAIVNGTSEVGPAVIVAVLTTTLSFIPVFSLEAAEGKLFHPLAWTKTFALSTALVLAIVVMPVLTYLSYLWRRSTWQGLAVAGRVAIGSAVVLALLYLHGGPFFWPLLIMLSIAVLVQWGDEWLRERLPENRHGRLDLIYALVTAAVVSVLLAREWLPLGPGRSDTSNTLFVLLLVGGMLGFFYLFLHFYARILRFFLEFKLLFLSLPLVMVLFSLVVWMGFGTAMSPVEKAAGALGWNLAETGYWKSMQKRYPGIGSEFMPALDEGSLLLMPTSMPHAGLEENGRVLRELDMAVTAIPEVEMVVGKAGRVESALDPAPLNMYENIIIYKPEYKTDANGHRSRFKVDAEGYFERDAQGELIPDPDGRYYRNWREHIQSPDDIWREVEQASRIPGVTGAPKLQPIETRLVMLQSGMRAPMGIKVRGTDLDSIQRFARDLEHLLKDVPGVKASAVFAEQVVGKPYLHLEVRRDEAARYGLTVQQVQEWIGIAIGGKTVTTTVEGRERREVRLRYPRALRDSPDAIGDILVTTPGGKRVHLDRLVDISFHKGPQVIKSEDAFLVSYVLFDKEKGHADGDVVERARTAVATAIQQGELHVPTGINYDFAGNFENQIRAQKRLVLIVPVVLIFIFLILYLLFRSAMLSLMVFAGIAVAFSGGFIMIWLYGQDWFMNFSLFGTNMRDLFGMDVVNLSVAVWVGFIALFGIATDDGVVMGTYLKQAFRGERAASIAEIRDQIVEAGQRRVRPCLMTTATTLLALLPVLSSTGRGADIMIPMAIPVFGGMAFELITLFVVPVLFSAWKESQLVQQEKKGEPQ